MRKFISEIPCNGIVIAAVTLMLSGCLGPVADLYPEDANDRPVPVHIVQVGWHAGLIVETEHLGEAFPEHEQIPDARYLKIGWGDDKYYPDPDPPFWVLLRAIFWPSRSVLHIVGVNVPVTNYFQGSEIITLHLSEEGMDKLTEFVTGYFRMDNGGNPIYHAVGRYGDSAFFKARGRYYIPNTSNVWTARALRSAGVPITPVYGVTARNVMRQAREVAERDSAD